MNLYPHRRREYGGHACISRPDGPGLTSEILRGGGPVVA